MDYAELSLFTCLKHNGGELMRRVVVRRVAGRGKEYAVGVCISMEA